jgi:DNA-binding response OmpR family regulator
VLLVDDDKRTSTLLARRLRTLRFEVHQADSFDSAIECFNAGFVDIVIADWDLEADHKKRGDALFEALRSRDWEVPLVLVSGKMTLDKERASTLAHVLQCGSAAFVERGQGFDKIIAAARDLLSRRDVALTGVIHKLRSTSASIPTTDGRLTSKKILADLLTDKDWKDGTLGPLAKEFAEWETSRLRRKPAS